MATGLGNQRINERKRNGNGSWLSAWPSASSAARIENKQSAMAAAGAGGSAGGAVASGVIAGWRRQPAGMKARKPPKIWRQ